MRIFPGACLTEPRLSPSPQPGHNLASQKRQTSSRGVPHHHDAWSRHATGPQLALQEALPRVKLSPVCGGSQIAATEAQYGLPA